jgi:flagellar basal-body rod modification protein FlgD
VAVESNDIVLEDGKAKFEYQIDRTASKAVMTVMNEQGQVVLVQEANKGVGTYTVDWNGKDAFGNKLPDGAYRVAVAYGDQEGRTYSAKITSYGVVDSTEIKDGQVKLYVGSVSFPIDKVVKITKPSTSDNTTT